MRVLWPEAKFPLKSKTHCSKISSIRYMEKSYSSREMTQESTPLVEETVPLEDRLEVLKCTQVTLSRLW